MPFGLWTRVGPNTSIFPQIILTKHTRVMSHRKKYFAVSSVTDLFKIIDNHTIINFIKETDFSLNFLLAL